MPMLVLDLDMTVFASVHDLDLLSPFHQDDLSQRIQTYNQSNKIHPTDVYLINKTHLSSLIETACKEWNAQIMILTSGGWHKTIIRNILSEHLDISEATAKKIQHCHFLNIHTCHKAFPELSLRAVQTLDKSERLSKYIEKHPQLQKTHFVALDDNADHVNSLNRLPNVKAILALTNLQEMCDMKEVDGRQMLSYRIKPDKQFYERALEAVEKAFTEEATHTLSELSSASFFTPPNLQALEQTVSEKQTKRPLETIQDDSDVAKENKKPRFR